MSTTIDQAFIRQYEREVHHVFQRSGGFLRPTVRLKTNVVGSSTTFQKIGTGTATTKARHGVVTPMNQVHTPIQCTLADFYAGDWVDKLDEAKTNIDERLAVATGGASALGRKVDSQIITALDTTTQTQAAVTVTSIVNVRATVTEWVEDLWSNNVPNDMMVFGLITPRLWSQLMMVEEFASADYIKGSDLPFNSGVAHHGRYKHWQGVNWQVHTGLPNVTQSGCKGFIWHQRAVGYATGKHAGNAAENESVAAEITYNGERVSHFVNHMMSGGACLIDDTGVIEGTWNDSSAIVTS